MTSPLRIGVTTLRHLGGHFSLQVQYDFEDCFCRATGAHLVQLPPPPRTTFARRCLRKFGLDPKIRVPDVERGLDLLFIPCMWPGQVTLDHIADWRRSCQYVCVYLFDLWPVFHKSNLLRGSFVEDVDCIFTSFHESVPYTSRLLGRPTHWLPQAVNPERFAWRDGNRGIFCTAMGRQDETFLSDARRYATAHDLLLVYQGEIGRFRRTYQDSYNLYASLLRHAKYSLNWSAKATHPDWQQEFTIDPPTCRWFEAAAAGVTMVGTPPTAPEFDALFPGKPVVDVAAFDADPARVFEYLEAQPQDELRRRAEDLSRLIVSRHTWYNRVHQLLTTIGMAEAFRPPSLGVPLDLSPLPAIRGT